MNKILEEKVKLMAECYKASCEMLTDVILKHNLMRVKSSDATRVAITLFKAVDEQNKLKEIKQ